MICPSVELTENEYANILWLIVIFKKQNWQKQH